MNWQKILSLAGCFVCLSTTILADDGFTANLNRFEGLYLRHGLTPVACTNRLIAVDPEWTHLFYDRTADTDISISKNNETTEVTLFQTTPNDRFSLDDFTVKTQRDAAEIRFAGTLKGLPAGTVEYTAMVLPKDVYETAEFEAVLADGSSASGVFAQDTAQGVHLVDNFKKLKLSVPNSDSIITIEVASGIPLSVIDNRNNPWFERNYGYLLLGNIPLQDGESFEHVLKITASLKNNESIARNQEELDTLPAHPVENIYDPAGSFAPFPELIRPKEETKTLDQLQLGRRTKFEFEGSLSLRDQNRLKKAVNRIFDDEIRDLDSERKFQTTTIRMVCTEENVPESPDGFVREITQDGIIIFSRSARGIFYGLQSLRQSIRENTVPIGKVVDYPDMEYRGVLIYAAKDSLPFYGKMIENVYAPLRYNQIVLGCERAAWKSTEALGIHVPNSMSLEEMRALAEVAEENFMEITPLISTLGHTGWLFANGKNVDLAEDPAFSYTYNVNDPRIYPLLEKIYEEAIAFFKPRYFHIAHDEIMLWGRYPYRQSTKDTGVYNAVKNNLLFFYNLLHQKGIHTIAWQDMFVSKEESPENGQDPAPYHLDQLRHELPKDLIFAVWRYDKSKTFGDLTALASEGFRVIGCPWNEDENVENMAQACKNNSALGMIQTTWIGYFNKGEALHQEFPQISAHIRGGVFSWNAENPKIDADKALRTLWKRTDIHDKTSGTALILPQGTGTSIIPAISSTPFTKGYVDGIWFERNANSSLPLLSRVQPDAPASIVIPVNQKFHTLHLLAAGKKSRSDQQGEAAKLTFRYEDGSSETVSLRGMLQIQPMDQSRTLNKGIPIAEGMQEHFFPFSLRQPQPQKEVSAIVIQQGDNYLPCELAALTLEY